MSKIPLHATTDSFTKLGATMQPPRLPSNPLKNFNVVAVLLGLTAALSLVACSDKVSQSTADDVAAIRAMKEKEVADLEAANKKRKEDSAKAIKALKSLPPIVDKK
jgi:hypothetical protein